MKKLRMLVGVAGATGALVLGTGPAALAGQDATAYYYNPYGQLAAHVHFYAYGEHFAICDDLVDGYSAAVDGWRPDGTPLTVWNDQGGNTCRDVNFGFPEGKTVTFRACVGKASNHVLVSCGAYVNATS